MPSSVPSTPHNERSQAMYHSITVDDLAVLDSISSPSFVTASKAKFRRRDQHFDPLIFAAALSSGPHITRHHYFHKVYPHCDNVPKSLAQHGVGSCDTCALREPSVDRPIGAPLNTSDGFKSDVRLSDPVDIVDCGGRSGPPYEAIPRLPSPAGEASPKYQRFTDSPQTIPQLSIPSSPSKNTTFPLDNTPLVKSRARSPKVQCKARTRVPTPHGPVFLHLYHNDWDGKEHLAVVVDSAQLNEMSLTPGPYAIRSKSLDSKWSETESEMDRIIRGAYVGRLSPTRSLASDPPSSQQISTPGGVVIPPPLVRIHSECFTGETIGSMRCDCGEQLDEAIRLISQPQILPQIPSNSNSQPTIIPGRGAVIYLRQEGRGIGLLEKIRAYNLQDLGHDTVTANLMLGHDADERGYEIAAAIMEDLGLGHVRLLTNNPDKIAQLENEGIRIADRVAMIPRTWKCGDDWDHSRTSRPHHRTARTVKQSNSPHSVDGYSDTSDEEEYQRPGGATLIGGRVTNGPELERYLRTKVQRMGHLLSLPTDGRASSSPQTMTEVHTPRAEEAQDDVMIASTSSKATVPFLQREGHGLGFIGTQAEWSLISS